MPEPANAPDTAKPASNGIADQKVFDVASPGTTAPSATARPVIVGNVPANPDPMVTPQPDAAALGEAGKSDEPETNLIPTAEIDQILGGKPAAERLVIAPLAHDKATDSPDDSAMPARAEQVAAPESAASTKEIAPKLDTTDITEEAVPAPVPGSEIKAAPLAVQEPPAEDAIDTAGTASTTAPNTTEDEAESEPLKPAGNTEEEIDPHDVKMRHSLKQAEKIAAQEAAKRRAQYETMIENKQYFVPISKMSKQQTRKYGLWLAVFAVLVAVAALGYWLVLAQRNEETPPTATPTAQVTPEPAETDTQPQAEETITTIPPVTASDAALLEIAKTWVRALQAEDTAAADQVSSRYSAVVAGGTEEQRFYEWCTSEAQAAACKDPIRLLDPDTMEGQVMAADLVIGGKTYKTKALTVQLSDALAEEAPTKDYTFYFVEEDGEAKLLHIVIADTEA